MRLSASGPIVLAGLIRARWKIATTKADGAAMAPG
jgi:hypothetical protein